MCTSFLADLHRRRLAVQLNGPGRSSRTRLARLFHDKAPHRQLHELKPFRVKLSRTGPNLTVFRIFNGIVISFLLYGLRLHPNRPAAFSTRWLSWLSRWARAPTRTARHLIEQ